MIKKETKERKARIFAEKYIENKLNATETVMQVFNPKDREVAKSMGSEYLAKPHVRTAVEMLLRENGLKIGEVINKHKRNIKQDKNLAVSQEAISDYYELVGLKRRDTEHSGVQVGVIIEK